MTTSPDPIGWPRTTLLSMLLALAAQAAETQAPGLALMGALGAIAGLLAALLQLGEP